MIPAKAAFLLLAMLLASACDWRRARQAEPAAPAAEAKLEADRARPASAQQRFESKEQPPPTGAATPMPKEIEGARDILVDTKPRCAFAIRYGNISNEFTWLGECALMKAYSFSLAELNQRHLLDRLKPLDSDDQEKRREKAEKLKFIEDCIRNMPNGRVIYIEEGPTSNLYLEFNDRVIEEELAD